MKKILVTSALPYANGSLHLGHIAGAYLPADCFVRFERLKGSRVAYICGSDEYGIAITINAEKKRIPYKDYVNLYHEEHKLFFKKLKIEFDHFSRTTNVFHFSLVQEFFQELKFNGYIEEKETEQLFSEKDKKFLADRYVEGTCPKCNYNFSRGDECQSCGASYESTDLINPKSKITGAPLSLKKTTHQFLCLDLLKDKIEKWLKSKNLRTNLENFIFDYLKDIHPRAITRDLEWGVPVIDSPGKVFYVWFDAPIGYISSTIEWSQKIKQNDLWKDFWLDPNVKYVQFLGKDNIPFHAVIFPAMLLGQNKNYKLVDDIVAYEFYTLEGMKFSKSEGKTIDIEDFLKKFSLDQLRYSLAATAPETSDTEFSWDDFQRRCNTELVGTLGNFVNRSLTFSKKLGITDLKCFSLDEESELFLSDILTLLKSCEEAYFTYSLRKATTAFMNIARKGNVYFNDKAPWVLAKNSEKLDEVKTILFCCAFCQRLIALACYPIMPDTANLILEMLGEQPFSIKENTKNFWEEFQNYTETSFSLKNIKILFSQVTDEVIEEEKLKLQQN